MNHRPNSFSRLLFHFASALVLATALSLVSAGAQTMSLAGHWEGSVQIPGSPLALSVDFTANPDGTLAGTVSIPAQHATDLALANISVNGTEVTFQLSNVPGDPKFTGRFDPATGKLTGQLSQGGQTFPFSIERKQDPAAAARQAMEGFDQVATDAMKKFDVPGMAIAIVKGKDVVYSKGFGYRDVEKQLPATPDTLFAIGSSTKAFTTFVLGTLVDEGKIEWEKPVRNYIPWFKMYDPFASEHLTPRDLVTHRSGLPRHDAVWYNNYDVSRKWLVERLAYLEPSADLRTKFQYNNLMFLTAGYLTEVVTGKSWEDNVRERVLDPLEMKRTNFAVADSQKDSDFSQPYQKKDDKVVRMPFRPITNLGPAGSINSSVNEMSHWVITHLNGGKYEGKQLANAATVDDMHLAHMTTGATMESPELTPADYGMGWFVETYRGHRYVQHGGNIDGFSAMVALFPDDQIGVVVLTNLNGTPLRDLIVRVIMDRIAGLKPIDWIGEGAAKAAKGEEAQKEGAKNKEAVRVQGTHPAHNPEDYAGDYENPGYGTLKVGLQEGHLEVTYNGIKGLLAHWHYETFSGMKAADDTFENMQFTFETDSRGYVSAVSVPLEPAVKDIVFTKKPDARLHQPDYLKQYVGVYEIAGQVWTVTLKGDALTVAVPGAPPLDLVPALGEDFALKQVQTVRLHFEVDGAGHVTGIQVRQPGAVLTAKRKE